MKLTATIDADIAAFEQREGVILEPIEVKLIKAMASTGDYFEDMGAEDASCGRTPLTKEDFIKWGKRRLDDPVGKDQPIVDLMYMCYLDGYNAGKEACHV